MDDKLKILVKVMLPALKDSLYMTFWASLCACIIGFFLAVILVTTAEDGLTPNKVVYRVLNVVVNICRSFPFIILAVTIMPLTRIVMGTSIGVTAALFPLTLVASPFVARILEGNLKVVDPGMIEAAKSFGASNLQIIFKIMLKEAIPSMCISVTVVVISVLGSSAMAGAIGAGGLGQVALSYGYQRYDEFVMYTTVIILAVLVQLLQTIGNVLYTRLK